MMNSSMRMSTSVKQYSYCPFDKNHLIESCKLLKHIKKCRSPTRRDFVECPFNPYHWLNFHQMDQHVIECPDQFGPVDGEFHPPVIPPAEVANHPLMANNASFISDVSRLQGEESQLSEIMRIAMDFNTLKQKGKPKGSEFDKEQFRKKFNHVELRELNREKAWIEPDFSAWYDQNYRHNMHMEGLQFEETQRRKPFQYLLDNDDF